jgi:hypothetical protein
MRLPLLPIATAIMLAVAPAAAQDDHTFVISDDGGYGLSDCFAPGVACGRMLADSLCAQRGHGPAVSFGLASDITASVPGPRKARMEAGGIIITCG